MGKSQQHNDNDIVESERRNNDNDIVVENGVRSERSLREEVLEEISEYKLDHIEDFLFGNNKFMSDCGAFINPAIKQIERFMYVWLNELSEETRRKIVCHTMNGAGDDKRPYSWFTNSPLWKYESSVFKLMCNFTCGRCREKFNPAHLVVHHISYEHIGSELDHTEDLVVLCTDCHLAVHNIRRKDDGEQ